MQMLVIHHLGGCSLAPDRDVQDRLFFYIERCFDLLAHCTVASEESRLNVPELCTIADSQVTKTTCLDISMAMVFIYYNREQFKGLSCCVPSGRPVCPAAFFSAFIHIRRFDRLMKRSIKHCCVTQCLTSIIISQRALIFFT